MKIGKNTDKYILGLLEGGPTGALRAGVDLKQQRRDHKRKKELKATPTTRNVDFKTSPGVTHVGYHDTNHGSSKHTENGDVNDNDWNYG